MKSMTGFATIEKNTKSYSLNIEIRSVNHRYRDLIIKLPPQFGALEPKIRKLASERAMRGHIEITVRLQELANMPGSALNRAVAASYLNALHELINMDDLMLNESMQPELLLSLPGMLVSDTASVDAEGAWKELRARFEEAFEQFDRSRAIEGEMTRADLSKKLDRIIELTALVEKEAASLAPIYAESLKKRIDALGGPLVDENRLIAEIIVFADKCSADEELSRLKLHCENLGKEMAAEGQVGRKIDFLLQEANREANTLASKTSSFIVSLNVAEIKNELEKMREQIQNIE